MTEFYRTSPGWPSLPDWPGVLPALDTHQPLAGSQDWQAQHQDDGQQGPESKGVFSVKGLGSYDCSNCSVVRYTVRLSPFMNGYISVVFM